MKKIQGSEGKFLINFKMTFLSFTGTDSPSHDACFKIRYQQYTVCVVSSKQLVDLVLEVNVIYCNGFNTCDYRHK